MSAVEFFNIDTRPGLGTVEVGLFIKDCLILGYVEGDCRTFSPQAGPTHSRAFIQLNFESGSGFVRVNPSCIDFVTRRCTDAYPIGGDFLGSPGLRKRNRFIVKEFEASMELHYGFVNSSATLLASLVGQNIWVPAITGHIRLGFSADSSIRADRFGDQYPSHEIYQRINGAVKTIDLRPERDLGAGVGTGCLLPLVC